MMMTVLQDLVYRLEGFGTTKPDFIIESFNEADKNEGHYVLLIKDNRNVVDDGEKPEAEPKAVKELQMETQQTNKRVRINLSQTAKGLVQFDITAEFETVDECKAALSAAVDAARAVIAEKGLKEVSA